MFVMAVAALWQLAALADDTVMLLSGETITAQISAMNEDGVLLDASGAPIGDGIQSVRRMVRDVKPTTIDVGSKVVLLSGGGLVYSQKVTTEGEEVVVDLGDKAVLRLPFSLVAAVVEQAVGIEPNKPLDVREKFEQALEQRSEREDALFVDRGSRLLMFTGALDSISDKEYVFIFDGEERRMARDRAYGLVFAQPTAPPDRMGQIKVNLQNGTQLWGRPIALVDGKLTVEPAPGRRVTLPWSKVTAVQVRSDRVTFLSDLNPVSVQEQSIMFIRAPWQRDTNVRGGQMQIADRVFEKGLGVHANSRLTFEVGGKYQAFAAVIGLDAITKDRGDCEFVVVGDGKELLRHRAKGGDQPKPIRVAIDGVKMLTLSVEAGEDLDLSDHANWADARVLRETTGE